ncbi:MAG TPA: MFS transporter [Thermoanaerobaculia bacterium]|nr:MFS transporter [Thermoanaerobaculia bacterium]
MPAHSSKVRLFRAVTLGHFGIDVFNSMGPVLLAFLQQPLGLSAAQVGLGVGVHQFLAGATQPPFGWLTDRIGSRWLGPGSVLLTMTALCASLWVVQRFGFWAFLPLFALAALGSGAFHPQGVMHSSDAVPGRAATTTSVFFLGGQLGLAAGPVLAGVVLDRLGLPGIWLLGLLFLPVPLYMATQMLPRAHNPLPVPTRRDASAARGGWSAGPLTLLVAIFSGRAWIFIGTVAFLPLLFHGKGWSASAQGAVAGAFWLGGAVTGVLAGAFADRVGRRLAVSASTGLGALLLLLLPLADGPGAVVLSFLCGGALGAPHSVLMVIAQDLLPVRRALASGLALGFLFAMGAIASWTIGALADAFALQPVLQGGALVGAAVASLALLLPRTAARGEVPAEQVSAVV